MLSQVFVRQVVTIGISALIDRALDGGQPSRPGGSDEAPAANRLAPITEDLKAFFATGSRAAVSVRQTVSTTPVAIAPAPTPAPTPAPNISSADKYGGLSQLSAKGKACVPCGNDHFSTAAGALSESLRFAAKGGLTHPEVLSRITLAMDEFNVFERVDGTPEKLAKLPPGEKAIMVDMMEKSRKMRHQLGDAYDYATLEAAAAQARNNRIELMGQTLKLRQQGNS